MTDDGVVRGRLTEGTDQPPVQPQQHADAPAPALHTDEEQSIDSSWINAGSSQLTLSASGISGKSPDIPQGAQNTPQPALYAGGGWASKQKKMFHKITYTRTTTTCHGPRPFVTDHDHL